MTQLARDFVEAMTLPVWQASAALRWLEGKVSNRPKTDQDTPVKAALTDADCVAQEILLTALYRFFPDVEVDAEEDTPHAKRFPSSARHRVVVDPLYGTLRYLEGDGLYAVLVGLERDDRVEAAVVAVPTLDLVLRAVRGEGAERVSLDGASEPVRLHERGSRVVVSYSVLAPDRAILLGRGLEPITGAGGAIGVAPLLDDTLGSIRTTADPNGLSRRTWVGVLPTLEAGGVVQTTSGEFPDRYRPGVSGIRVAASPDALERLRL